VVARGDGRRSATLGVRPHGELAPAERAAVQEEAACMLRFAAGDAAERAVGVEPAVGG
jgi:hypothetical protein